MKEILFKSIDNKTGIWYQDGDIFYFGNDPKRKYPCKVTNHGILYTKTHIDTEDTIVRCEDGREGYTDWDYETLYTDVVLCQLVTEIDGQKIFHNDTFKVWLEDSVEKEGGYWWECYVEKFKGCWCLLQIGFDYSNSTLNEVELLFETDYKLVPTGNIHDKK